LIIQKLMLKHKTSFLWGDWNINFLQTSPHTRVLNNLLLWYDLKHIVNVPTRITKTTHFTSATLSGPGSEWQISLCQGYLIIHISAWSSNPDHPPIFRKDCLLVDQTNVHQSVFTNKATDWRFSIVITSRTDTLFIRLDFVTDSCQEITELLHREHDELSCGKRACKIPLWSTTLECILATAIFRLHVSWTIMK
jgi:hypothetical protein